MAKHAAQHVLLIYGPYRLDWGFGDRYSMIMHGFSISNLTEKALPRISDHFRPSVSPRHVEGRAFRIWGAGFRSLGATAHQP